MHPCLTRLGVGHFETSHRHRSPHNVQLEDVEDQHPTMKVRGASECHGPVRYVMARSEADEVACLLLDLWIDQRPHANLVSLLAYREQLSALGYVV